MHVTFARTRGHAPETGMQNSAPFGGVALLVRWSGGKKAVACPPRHTSIECAALERRFGVTGFADRSRNR
jgi:hypothetical protein